MANSGSELHSTLNDGSNRQNEEVAWVWLGIKGSTALVIAETGDLPTSAIELLPKVEIHLYSQ